MSGSLEHITEQLVVPELRRIADALEELVGQARPVIAVGKQAIEEDLEERSAAPPRPTPPRVPRRP